MLRLDGKAICCRWQQQLWPGCDLDSVAGWALHFHRNRLSNVPPNLRTNCAMCNWIYAAAGDKLWHSLTPASVRAPLTTVVVVIDAVYSWSSSASTKCDLNSIILNYFVTCISFQFHFKNAQTRFHFHSHPSPLSFFEFSCSIFACIVFFLFFCWFTWVDFDA